MTDLTARVDAGPAGATQAVTVRDDRGFYRRALAIVAPLPMLAMGMNYLLQDAQGTEKFRDTVDAVARNEGVINSTRWLGMLFFALLVPAVIAVAAVARRRSPRLTIVGVCLTVPGLAAAFGMLPNDVLLASLAHQEGLDIATVEKLDKAWWAVPEAGLAALLFLVAIVIGLLLLGIGLARSHLAPAWTGVALAVGGFTHPFIPSHVGQGVGLLVAAAGFAGASAALWRMRDDEFAPRGEATTG